MYLKNHYTLFVFSFLFFISCQNEDSIDDDNDLFEMKTSSFNSDDSHNFSQNCMSCHTENGTGEGVFEVAGTIYGLQKVNTYPNATVNFFTEPNGNGILKYTIEVDKLGNFYTTSKLDFDQGLYTAVQGNTEINYMNGIVSSGQCNSCHGTSTERIWTN